MIPTDKILTWLTDNRIFIVARHDDYSPSIPYFMNMDQPIRQPFFLFQAEVKEHQGHRRLTEPCYLRLCARVPSQINDQMDQLGPLLKTVTDHYPDSEWTIPGRNRITLSFNKADTINLVLQLGL